MQSQKLYKLLGPDGTLYLSDRRGLFGGHRGGRGYGRMDCRAALRAIARGGYVRHRVFFTDEPTAIAAGYRPCAVCLPDRYALWKVACAQADVPRLVRSRVRRQPALDIYRHLLTTVSCQVPHKPEQSLQETGPCQCSSEPPAGNTGTGTASSTRRIC